MILNTRTLKNYPDTAEFSNVKATYSYRGDRLVWTRSPTTMTKSQILKERESNEKFCKKGLRWEGTPLTTNGD